MKRLMPRALVVFTVLVVLGVGGYAGQVWWARRVALENAQDCGDLKDPEMLKVYFATWRMCPWYGLWRGWRGIGWVPRRTFLEGLRLCTGQDFPDEPSVWEAWFKAHPNLVWDAKQKRLVDPKP